MQQRAPFFVVIMSIVAVAACPKPGASGPGSSATPAPKGERIAKIGDTVITVDQLQKRLDEQSPFVRVRYADPDKKKEFLESQIRFEVLAAEAFARGMDKDPEVLEATKKIIVQKLTRDEFDGRVKLNDVTDADLQKYFEEHKGDYQKPEMARASDIAIAFGADKAKAKKTAEEAHKKAADPAKVEDRNAFKDLVAQYSTDEGTKRAGGDLRYVTAEEAEQKLGAAAKTWLFSAEKINEVSAVLEGPDAFHILKRTGTRKAISRDFDQVKSQIKNVVFREKRTASFTGFVDELKKKHSVSVDESKLDLVKVSAQMPPGAEGHPGDPHAGLGIPDPHADEHGAKDD